MARKIQKIENKLFILLLFLFILLFLFFWKNYFVNFLWFNSLGYASCYLTVIKIKVLVFLFFCLLSFLLLFLNSFIIKLNIRKVRKRLKPGLYIFQSVLSLVIVSFIFAIIPAQWWEEILNFLNAVKFNIRDPLFHTDIGFYVFKLPLFNFLQGWCFFFLLFLLIWSVLFYLFARLITWNKFSLYMPDKVRYHLGSLFVLLIFNLAISFYLRRFVFLFDQDLVIKGASYVDVHSALPFSNIFFVFFLLTGLVLIWWMRRPKNIVLAVPAILLFILFLLNSIYPFLIQQFIVLPHEMVRERPYVENTLKFTRIAYKLNMVKQVTIDLRNCLNLKQLKKEGEVLSNVKLWDSRQIKNIFNQSQSFKPYYLFYDVDTDRYRINGRMQAVMIAGREISRNNLPGRLKNWVNQHLRFTHGYGVVMCPVGVKDKEGGPQFLIKNMPVVSSPGLSVSRPEIYFGEVTGDYVIVNTRVREFDHPYGVSYGTSTYHGDGGIGLDHFWKKLLMAVHFSDLRILFSPLITDKSRIMIKRNIVEIAKNLVPFLLLDNDPYLVIVQGKLYWFMDAYTVTDKFPYSEMYSGMFNYIRNSVKIVINAYTGKVDLYVVDPRDPMIRSYQKAFPGLFKSLSKLPQEFREHFCYPADFFRIQAEIFTAYHVKDPDLLYHNQDLWEIPSEVMEEEENLINKYSMIQRTHDQDRVEFLNMIPYKAVRQDYITGILLGGCDSNPYGYLTVYQYTNKTLTYDMIQMNGLINEDLRISEFINFWEQKGGKVISGDFLIIPVGESVLYVQPLFVYLEEKKSTLLKKLILFYKDRLLLCDTIQDGLRQIISGNIKHEDDYKTDVVSRMNLILEKLSRENRNRSEIDELKQLLKQMK